MRKYAITLVLILLSISAKADDAKKTEVYKRIRLAIDAVPAIDTHDHLRPFDQIAERNDTDQGRGMTLHSIWRGSYYSWTNPLTHWKDGESFDSWWLRAKPDFKDAHATSFYRYVLPAFKDLYGIDFETMTDIQARQLNQKIFENYQDDTWLKTIVTERANIELMFIDPYWARLKFDRAYHFAIPVLNVTTMVDGYHRDAFASDTDSPYAYAEGIYAATVFSRQCLSESLAEKAIRDELSEEQAIHIGTQIMRENALKLFPKLRRQLWKKYSPK